MILIVDDTIEIVDWLVDVVTEEGYYADYAMSGDAALYKIARIHYSLALVDIRIPKMDGNELARQVKKLPEPFCEVPLVAMTGGRLPAETDLFAAVLQKPFFPKDLRDIIAAHARPPIKELHFLA